MYHLYPFSPNSFVPSFVSVCFCSACSVYTMVPSVTVTFDVFLQTRLRLSLNCFLLFFSFLFLFSFLSKSPLFIVLMFNTLILILFELLACQLSSSFNLFIFNLTDNVCELPNCFLCHFKPHLLRAGEMSQSSKARFTTKPCLSSLFLLEISTLSPQRVVANKPKRRLSTQNKYK